MANLRVILPAVTPPTRHKVAAYTRVSTDSERQLSSLAAQISYYSHLIQSTPGWQYAGVFSDEGITGTRTNNRPGLQDLLEKAHARSIDVVLCKSISRLARNTVDLLEIIRELKTLGVSVRFERENIDTSTVDGELLITLLASFAQEESLSLSKNVKWAIRNRYKNGGTNSFTIYGYTWTGDGFTINEAEAKVVRILFANYLAGISPEKTACLLNEQGLRSRGGGKFRGSVFRRMLENERYKGCQLLQKTYNHTVKAPRRSINDGVLPKYWVEHALPAIIEPDQFDAVQTEILHRRKKGSAATPSKNTGIFTGRIRCGICKKNYQRKTRRYPSGHAYKFWRCWTACKGNGNPCGSHNLREAFPQQACAMALGLEEYGEHSVDENISLIEAFPDRLVIHHTSGQKINRLLDSIGNLA